MAISTQTFFHVTGSQRFFTPRASGSLFSERLGQQLIAMLIPIRLPALHGNEKNVESSTCASSEASNTDVGNTSTSELEEWSLVELNGTLNCSGRGKPAFTEEGLGGLPLGDLSFPALNKVR